MLIELPIHTQLAGIYGIWKRGLDGRVQRFVGVAPRAPNLITDGGLERLAAPGAAWCSHMMLSSDGTPPAVTDTSFGASQVAVTSTIIGSTTSAQASPPYYGSSVRTFEFAQPASSYNASKIAVGWGTSGPLFSSALILDEDGEPTTISVSPFDVVQGSFELRNYPPLDDVVVVIGARTLTIRAASVTASSLAVEFAGPMGGNASATNTAVRSGGLGAITGQPSGSSSSASSSVSTPYENNRTRRRTAVWGRNTANQLIGSIVVTGGIQFPGVYQIGVAPTFTKLNTQELTAGFTYSYGRAA